MDDKSPVQPWHSVLGSLFLGRPRFNVVAASQCRLIPKRRGAMSLGCTCSLVSSLGTTYVWRCSAADRIAAIGLSKNLSVQPFHSFFQVGKETPSSTRGLCRTIRLRRLQIVIRCNVSGYMSRLSLEGQTLCFLDILRGGLRPRAPVKVVTTFTIKEASSKTHHTADSHASLRLQV